MAERPMRVMRESERERSMGARCGGDEEAAAAKRRKETPMRSNEILKGK